MPIYDMSRNFFTTQVDEGTPFAPIAAWSSSGLDYTPNFDVSLPAGMNDPTDAAVGDIVFGEYQIAGGDWSNSHSYLSYTLTAPDLVGGATVTVSGISNLTPGNYDFRFDLQRTVNSSAWSNTVTIVLIPPTSAVKTLIGSATTIASGVHSLSQAFTIPNNCVVVVGGYWRIGDESDAPMTASCGSTNLPLYVPSVIDGTFASACGFASGVVTTGGLLNVTVDFGSSTAGQIIGFYVWTITGLTHTSPKAGASQLNGNLTPHGSNPPSQITVAATDFAFAVAQHSNFTTGNFQPSTPPADNDPSTNAAYNTSAYGVAVAGDWEIGANGTLTVATNSNLNNTARSVISFDTTP
jgi:hypothetical protein